MTVQVRYVELVRVSTEGQAQRDTPERQRHELDKFRDRSPGVVVERIEAAGVSGTLPLAESREGRRLIELAGKFDELRVVHVSRVFGARSGDPADQVAVASLCYKVGAIIATTEGRRYDPRNPIDMMQLAIECAMASKDRSLVVTNGNQGRMSAARRGGSPGGRRYYGRRYDVHTEQWAYVDVERDAVRELLAWIFDEGISFNECARRMNAKRVPTMLGQKTGTTAGVWYARTITSLLRQRHLVGETFYTNVHAPGEHVELRIPPLMTEAKWERLQALLDAKRPTSRPADPNTAALCLGRVYCPCGARLYRKGEFYFCSSSHTTNKIIGKDPCAYVTYHRVDAVDAAAWEAIVHYVSRDMIAEATETAPDVTSYQEEIERCERMLADLAKREKFSAAQHRRGKISNAVWDDECDEYARDRKTLERTLKAAQQIVAQADAAQMSSESLAAAVAGLRDAVRHAAAADRRALLHALIPDQLGFGIVVQPDGRIEIAAGVLAADDIGASGGSGRARRSKDKLCSPACRGSRRAA